MYACMSCNLCMSVFFLLYERIHVCVYVCMHVCMYVYVYIYIYCVYVCMYVCVYVCMYVCMHVCMCVRSYFCRLTSQLLAGLRQQALFVQGAHSAEGDLSRRDLAVAERASNPADGLGTPFIRQGTLPTD